MEYPLKAALIGLDTMHAVEFARILQDPETPVENQVKGMVITRCLRFKTPFQSHSGLDARQKYLEALGVLVTENFNDAVADCDVILLTIDDPAFHYEYFLKCSCLGKMIYVDKPLADNVQNSLEMLSMAQKNNIDFFTASALRFDQNISQVTQSLKPVKGTYVYGAIGKAPAGSSIIWYAVHSFEILSMVMGTAVKSIEVTNTDKSLLCHFVYQDNRSAVVELINNSWKYGGVIHFEDNTHHYFEHSQEISFYKLLLEKCISFFRGENIGVDISDSIKIMAMLEAAELSMQSGEKILIDNIMIKDLAEKN